MIPISRLARTDRPASADVLIVGSGMAGSAAAAEFARRLGTDATILMVEAGPALGDRFGENLKNIPDLGAREEFQRASQGPDAHGYGVSVLQDRTRSTAGGGGLARPGTFLASDLKGADFSAMPAAALSSSIGGMGVHWTCACPTPWGAEMTPLIPGEEMDRWLAEARARLFVTDSAYPVNEIGARILEGISEAFPDLPPGRRPGRMPLAVRGDAERGMEWTGSGTLLESVPELGDVSVRPETIARRIVLEGSRAAGLIVADASTGEEWMITCRVLFIGADALRTPQLLFASGIRPDALGRNLNDHTELIVNVEVDTEAAPPPSPATGEPLIGAYWIPFSEAHPAHGQVMQFDIAPLPQDEPTARRVPTVNLAYFVPKDIRPEDRLRFSEDTTDQYGMPAISAEYGLSAVDEESVQRVREIGERTIAAIGRPVPGDELTLLPAGSSLHYQGTVRMGEDPSTSVVDRDGRVWGLENVFLGGNGVLGTPTAGNPTLTTVAFTLRTATVAAKGL